MRIAWIVYGALEQRTGGYIYDAAIVNRLRAAGDWVDIVSIAARSDPAQLARTLMHGRYEAIVGDALPVRELGGALPRCEARAARVLLVHHMKRCEYEEHDAHALPEDEARPKPASDHCRATRPRTA